jgi:protein phosphatase
MVWNVQKADMNLRELKKYTSDPCVIVMVGSSGSGKSTLAQELANGPHEIVSSDHYRGVLSGDPTEQRVTGIVFQMIYDIIKIRSEYRQRTILDATNLKRQNRKAYYGPVVKGLPSYAVLVDADEELCKERNSLRDRKVPEWVLEKHAQRFQHAKKNILDETEKWTGVFHYDSETGEIEVLR